MIDKHLTEHHLEFLSLKRGCRGSSESTLSKCQIVGNLMPRLNIKDLGLMVSDKKIFSCFPYTCISLWKARDHQGGAIFGPRGII